MTFKRKPKKLIFDRNVDLSGEVLENAKKLKDKKLVPEPVEAVNV